MSKKNKKQNQNTISTLDAYLSLRKTWGSFKPTSRIKGNQKKQNSKSACRTKIIPT